MPDIQRNAQSITTTSATTAPAAGTSETWTVTALAAGIRTLAAGETYALVDATSGATSNQSAEIIRVTAATAGATSITVTRGVDGTTPVAHANPSTFAIIVTAGAMPKTRWPSYAALVSNQERLNDYDPTRGIYNYKSTNTRIMEQGLSRAMRGGITTHLVIGDSVSAGAIAQSGAAWLFDRLSAWPLAMRDQLMHTGTPANGTGIVRHVDSTVGIDSRWASTGTWTGFSWGAQTTVVGSTATLTPDRPGTIFDYWYYDSAGGTFTISVDGTVVKTVVSNGSAGWKNAHCTGLNIIENVTQIKITLTVSGAAGLISAGGSVWSPNGGLLVHNPSQSGSTASGTGAAAWSDFTLGSGLGSVYKDVAGRKRTITDAVSTAGSATVTSATAAFTADDVGKPWNHIVAAAGPQFQGEVYIGAFTNSTTVVIYSGITGAPILASNTTSAQTATIGRDPDCVHIALGANDITALSATDSTITAAITSIRNQYPNSDCILHLPHEVSTTLVSSARYLTYQAALYALADTLDIPLYDWRDRVGSYASGLANGSYGDNQAHITPATEADLGSQLAWILGGGSGNIQSLAPVQPLDVVNKSYIDNKKAKVAGFVTASNSTEQVVLRLPVPANTFKVGDVVRYAMSFRPSTSSIVTVRVRIGATGTTSDTSVVTMSATALANAGTRYCEGQTGIQAIGASATHLGSGTETVAAITAGGTASATSGTFNSTVINYVTVTLQNTTAGTDTVYAGSVELV